MDNLLLLATNAQDPQAERLAKSSVAGQIERLGFKDNSSAPIIFNTSTQKTTQSKEFCDVTRRR